MSDFVVLLILMALALAYVSLLLFIHLGSLGINRGRVIGIVIEVWLTFALIIGVFSLLQYFIGPVPQSTVAGEMAALFARLGRLPVWQRLFIYGGLAAAVALFAHLLWMLRAAQRELPRAGTPPDGDADDGTA